MPRPRKGYGKTNDGRKYVGVTTVLSYFGNKNGLIIAANKLGLEGFTTQEVWGDAANAGTVAHALIDAYLLDQPEPDLTQYPIDVISKAETAFLGFLQWATLVDFKIIVTEQTLKDETLGLAGTPDLAAIQGKRCIIDWKTSKQIYPESWGQIAAYKYLWEANNPNEPIEEGYILQLNKEDGGFSYHHKPSLDIYWEFYQHLLTAYRIYKDQMGGN